MHVVRLVKVHFLTLDILMLVQVLFSKEEFLFTYDQSL